jgi:hypothetical protein
MNTVEQRDFSTFEFGDDVYRLADGLIPEIADRLGVAIGEEPTSTDLQAIMDKVGPNKVLRHNAEVEAIDRAAQVTLVERSNVQSALQRSLWTPDVAASSENVDRLVMLGAVANWQDRGADAIPPGMDDTPIHYLTGTRVMDTGTEKSNLNIALIHATFGRYPTESEYGTSVVVPKFVKAGRAALASPFNTKDGDVIFDEFFTQNPDLLEQSLAIVRVANAGVIMALQMRNAAQKINPQFDKDRDHPQAFVITDAFSLARSEDDEKNPGSYQKAATALRQVVLTAKKLHEATIA